MLNPDVIGRHHAGVSGFVEGARVRITHKGKFHKDPTHGWFPFRECLGVGASGTCVERAFYNSHAGKWNALVRLDVAWTVHEYDNREPVRYWYGDPSRCPPEWHNGYDNDLPLFYMRCDHLAVIADPFKGDTET